MSEHMADRGPTSSGSEHQRARCPDRHDSDHGVVGGAAAKPVSVPRHTVPTVAIQTHANGPKRLAQLLAIVRTEAVSGVGHDRVWEQLALVVMAQQPGGVHHAIEHVAALTLPIHVARSAEPEPVEELVGAGDPPWPHVDPRTVIEVGALHRGGEAAQPDLVDLVQKTALPTRVHLASIGHVFDDAVPARAKSPTSRGLSNVEPVITRGDNRGMPLYRDAAIVLRTHKLGEADRIVTMLTRGRGKVRAVAKGVRRTRSKFGARLEPGMVVDVQCYEGRNLDTVTQAEGLASYGEAISHDYDAWTAANAMLELCDHLISENEVAPQQFVLLAGGLSSLASGEHEPRMVLDSYLLRTMAIAGWAASFYNCARCGAPGPHRGFNVAIGGAVCPVCRPLGSSAPAPETFILLGELQAGDWDGAEASARQNRTEASGLVAAYLQWHLERGLRALRYVEAVEPPLT